MTGQTAAHAGGDRAVVAIDVGDEILRDEALPIARGHRVRIHAALVQRERIGHDDDQLAEALGGGKLVGAFGKLGEPAVERVVASAVAMQQIHHRIAAGLIAGIARRQVDGDLAIGGIGLEISLERLAVHDDVLDGPGAGALCRPGPAGAPPRLPWAASIAAVPTASASITAADIVPFTIISCLRGDSNRSGIGFV